MMYRPAQLLAAWDCLLAQDTVCTDAMTIDLVWVGRQLLGDLFLTEKQAFDRAFTASDSVSMLAHDAVMSDLLADLDLLNATLPHATLDHWLQQARALGVDPQVKDYYEMNARRIITTWGGNLNDYACHNWNGLLADYYAHRWRIYCDEAFRAVRTGHDFDDEARHAATASFQEAWAVSTVPGPAGLCPDVLSLSRHLRTK